MYVCVSDLYGRRGIECERIGDYRIYQTHN
jgi:hypothetical protein